MPRWVPETGYDGVVGDTPAGSGGRGAVVRQVDPAARAARAVLVARLRQRRGDGALISAEVRAAAVALGVAERTVWRWVSEENPPAVRAPRPRYELTEADRDDYAEWTGNIAAMRRARLQRAFARELSPGERTYPQGTLSDEQREAVLAAGRARSWPRLPSPAR